MSQKISKK
jgi:hypothetical protein